MAPKPIDRLLDRTNALITRFQPPIHPRTRGGPLQGLSLALKDIFCLAGHPNTCASKTLKHWRPTYDSAVVSALKCSGVRLVGKTNMDEFSMGSSSAFSHFGPVLNPHDPCRSPGGSSGGSAASVSTALCDLAIGSDTGGSTRLPAAYCGLVGLKPSYGSISRYGMVQYSHSFDCVGLMGRSVELVGALFDVLAGFDPRDPTSVAMQDKSKEDEMTSADLSDLSIGIPMEYFSPELDPKIVDRLREAASALKSRGARLVSVSLPTTDASLGAYYVIASAEASSNLARYSGLHYGFRAEEEEGQSGLFVESRSVGFGDEVKRRILLGTYALSASGMENYFLKAQRIKRQVAQDFDRAFERVDIILTPPTLSIAPKLGREDKAWAQDRLLAPANLAGLPALVVPLRTVEGMPVGGQLIGPWGTEGRLLRVGKALMEVSGQD